MAKLQSDFEETAISHQELNETYESLVADHEQLQQLNDQVAIRYKYNVFGYEGCFVLLLRVDWHLNINSSRLECDLPSMN